MAYKKKTVPLLEPDSAAESEFIQMLNDGALRRAELGLSARNAGTGIFFNTLAGSFIIGG